MTIIIIMTIIMTIIYNIFFFRIIKENKNLDYLEESDDETEFEDNNEEKFVHLNKSYNMTCVLNNKFKKWTPISVSNNDNVVSTHLLPSY